MAKAPISQEEIQDIREYKQYLDDTIVKYKSLQEELKKYNKYVATGAREAVKSQLREITEQLGTYKEITSELKKYENLIKKIEKQEEQIKNQTKERLEGNEDITESLDEQNKKLEEQSKRIKNLGDDWNEIDDLQTSISSAYGKQYGDVGAIQKKIDGTKAIVSSISEVLKNDSDSYKDQLDKILEISEKYKEFPADFARMNKERKRGTLTEKSMLDQLSMNLDEFDEMISKIQITNEETQNLVNLFKNLRDEQASFNDAQKTKYEFKEGVGEFGNRFFGGAPYIGDAISSSGQMAGKIFSGETLGSATMVGAAYLLAKGAAYEKAIVDVNAGVTNAMQTFIGTGRIIDTYIAMNAKDVESRTKEIELKEGFTENFAKFDFETEMMQLEKQFNKVSKTAFFGSGLGSVKYAKDQLELAGISAETIVSAMTDMSMGANSAMKSLGTDVAVFSKKTGIASNQVAGLTGLFRMLDKTGGNDAFDSLQESLSGVGLGGFNIADIAGELQNSSELALEYNIKNSAELVKQVKNVRDMGASYSKIAEAGKSMVLNYKDSIRKEMELSAMLGENVDLSEARALFSAGRNDEAFGVLKSSGILEKAQSQGLFAVQALQGAIGGMSLTQLGAQQYEKGPNTGLSSNSEFLSAFKEAAKTQKIESATLDVERAIIRMRANNLERGLIETVGFDEELATLEVAKIQLEIEKFFKMELGSLKEGLNPFKGLGTFGKTEGIDYIKAPPKGGFRPGQSYNFDEVKPGTPTSKITPKINKNEILESTAIAKPLEESNQSLKKINDSSNAQSTFLQNIQTLTAAMAGLTDPKLGLKLIIDGKDVKSRIEKIQGQEKGKTKSYPA